LFASAVTAFVHGWPPWAVVGCWPRAAQKAANVCRRKGATGQAPACARILMGSGLVTLRTRADFLRVAAVRRRAVTLGLVLQAAPRPHQLGSGTTLRVGFTASRKVGNAVIRNRAKRRLRCAAAAVLPSKGEPGTDYVLIARASTPDRPYAALVADLEAAVRRLNRGLATTQADAAKEDMIWIGRSGPER
jgi:ribonuclease P protein component